MWSLVPLIGWVKDVEFRVAWGMASNVLLLEGVSGAECRTRCQDIARHGDRGMLIRTFITIPILLYLGTIVLYVIGEQLVRGDWLFVCLILFVFWLSLPASAAANTFAYLEAVSQER
jgi:hypothetical protein